MPIKCPIKRAEYMQQYNSDPVNKARKAEYDKQYSVDPFKKHLNNIMYKYGLTEEMFIKLYEKQDGLCLGCDIVLVTRIIGKRRR